MVNAYRATRATHLNSETMMREAKDTAGSTMILVDEDWLPALCWCTAEIVGVPQREIWDTITRSCGRECCRNPVTHEQVLGNAVSNSGTTVQACVCLARPPCSPQLGRGRCAANPARALYRQPLFDPAPATRAMAGVRRAAYRASLLAQQAKQQAEVAMRRSERAARRDQVAIMWEAGGKVNDIARELGVKTYQVYNDLNWLQNMGRLTRRLRRRRTS